MADKTREVNGTDHNFRYFLYGGVVGTLATLFLAPKCGKEARKIVADNARLGKDAVEQTIKSAKESVKDKTDRLLSDAEELLSKAKNLTKREKETILAAIEAGKDAYREEKSTRK